MTKARSTLVDPATTPYYHCIGRCVRRAFLCGQDDVTGRSFAHRRQWFIDRLAVLVEVYCIDLCAYAVMSNHYHLVVRADPRHAAALDDRAVMNRWATLHQLPMLVHRYQRGETTTDAENRRALQQIAVLRSRLGDLSWFLRELNEHIARRANAEDGCSGRFWEGRFKSQALLDEAALFTCMAYVDLNPIRAAMAKTPEASDYTSIQARIRGDSAAAPVPLLPFRRPGDAVPGTCLPMEWPAYLELVDWTGRAVLPQKRGSIPYDTPPVLQRLGIDPEEYLRVMSTRGGGFRRAAGSVEALRKAAQSAGRHHAHGIRQAKRLFTRK